jgi:hypothetical protein
MVDTPEVGPGKQAGSRQVSPLDARFTKSFSMNPHG